MAKSRKKVVIVGGGAAGFFAAINCAEANPNRQVILLEGTRRLLTKVRISGGGRCNVTHFCFDARKLASHYPRGERELLGPFSRFQAKDTVAWFERRGVKLKAEGDGRMFSVTDSSQTIIDCLVAAAANAGVEVVLGCKVNGLTRDEEGALMVDLHGREPERADYVLLATGSAPLGYELAASMGHRIVSPVPSLFTFKIFDRALTALAGVSHPLVDLRLSFAHDSKVYKQTGPLLITHWGVSGPAVLKLSAWGARELFAADYQADLVVNWLPGSSLAEVKEQLVTAKQLHPTKTVIGTSQLFPLPKRLWQYLVQRVEAPAHATWAAWSHKQCHELAEALTQCVFKVAGKGEFKEEFVTCGGVELKEVNFQTMASKLCPQLYFAGEILNIDGITGGFNFQNAWTTGWLAAQAMAAD